MISNISPILTKPGRKCAAQSIVSLLPAARGSQPQIINNKSCVGCCFVVFFITSYYTTQHAAPGGPPSIACYRVTAGPLGTVPHLSHRTLLYSLGAQIHSALRLLHSRYFPSPQVTASLLVRSDVCAFFFCYCCCAAGVPVFIDLNEITYEFSVLVANTMQFLQIPQPCFTTNIEIFCTTNFRPCSQLPNGSK